MFLPRPPKVPLFVISATYVSVAGIVAPRLSIRTEVVATNFVRTDEISKSEIFSPPCEPP